MQDLTRVISSVGRAPALQAGCRRFDPVITHHFAVVAQLVRVSACHAEGRGFESRPPRQNTKKTPFEVSFLLSAEFTGRMWACCYQIFCSIQIQIILTRPHNQWWGYPRIFNGRLYRLTLGRVLIWLYSGELGLANRVLKFKTFNLGKIITHL